MPVVELRHVSKSFGHVVACRDVSLRIEDGEFVTLLGPSGCGKTTTLNIIAGLEDCSTGDVLIGSERANSRSPVERDVAMVFQDYALYPHMTVAQNIGFTLRMRGVDRGTIKTRVEKVAASLELSSTLNRLPSQLSGGQQQRVAIGRALIREPRIFLFDEPFSNLDAALRLKMRAEVKELHQALGVTSIFVTHDQEEAMAISDRIAVMNSGHVEQFGEPEEIYSAPATRYVATFIGNPQIELSSGVLVNDGAGPACLIGSIRLPLGRHVPNATSGQPIDIGVRPEHVRLGDRGVPAKVRLVQPVGSATHVTLDWEGGTLVASMPGFLRIKVGSDVMADIDTVRLLVFDRASGLRL